ncbi:lipopolysaccharide biosynthesis protein [Marinobacter sp. X15-166B]|uniref:lipopolysaccharide biosynthesis protein n=1 Tax=Marinobacter sp. X15-166B TaxID=1897620 RepID=UPI000943AB0C|nr:oligosaccharide flippase family protein [Marinobacter sp. X15-166B]
MTLLKRLIRGSAFRTLNTIVSIAIGFFMLPFLLNHLGEDIYGIWVLVGSITASFYLFDLGFASAVTRFIAAALTRKDKIEAQQVCSTAFILYCGLGVLIIVATCALALLTPNVTSNSENDRLIQLLIIITGLRIAIGFPFKSFAGIISYHIRFDLMAATRLFFVLASTIATVIAILTGKGIIAVAIIGLVSSFVSDIVFRVISSHMEPQVKIKLSSFSRSQLKALYSFSAWAFLIDISRLLQERAPVWSIGIFSTPNY